MFELIGTPPIMMYGRNLMAQMTKEQLKYDREQCLRKVLLDIPRDVGTRTKLSSLTQDDIRNDDAILHTIAELVKKADVCGALQLLQVMLICADIFSACEVDKAQLGALTVSNIRNASGAPERRLIKLATLHVDIWKSKQPH